MTERPGGASTGARWRDLRIRIVSAAVLIPLVLASVRLGSWWYAGLVAVVALLMAGEWTRLVHAGGSVQFLLHAAGGLAGALLPALVAPAVVAWVIAGLWLASVLVARLTGTPLTLWSLSGVPYVSLPAASLVLLRADAAWGFQAVIWLLVVVWLADTGAYFAGRIIGGPKLAPAISPGKTWAGLGGAIGGGAVGALAVAAWSGTAKLWPLVVLGGILALIEQAGDLFESALKRRAGVKDSGFLVPGHGGALDRVDGLVAAAVAATIIGVVHGKGGPAATGLLSW